MSIEILSGDFAPERTRIRYSDAGRAHLRLTSRDGRRETVVLESDVAGAAAAERQVDGDCRIVVVLRDGRRFTARASCDVADQIRTAAVPPERRDEMLARLAALEAAHRRPEVHPEPRPGLLARLLPAFAR